MVSVAMISCVSPTVYKPQKGDLVFILGDSSSDFSDAITDATVHRKDQLKFDHVAIVDVVDGEPCVVEASSFGGVKESNWEEFKQSATLSDGRCGIVVKRLTVAYDVDAVIMRARKHLGEEYDWSFRPDNGKMYCSELVFESYLDNEGRHLFDAGPMSFRDAEGNMPRFWTDLFERLGEEVPEGVVGTNPTDMSKSEILIEVTRLF